MHLGVEENVFRLHVTAAPGDADEPNGARSSSGRHAPVDDFQRVQVFENSEDFGRVKLRALLIKRADALDPVEQLAVRGQVEHEICDSVRTM